MYALSSATTAAKPSLTTLHLLSNFALGETAWNPYWQEQIASLRQQALPFTYERSVLAPSLILDEEASQRLSPLFDAGGEQVEQWSTWCTFLCPAQKLSESFLLLNLTYPTTVDAVRGQLRQKHELVFRFQHRQHLQLLEDVERADRTLIYHAALHKALVVPFLDPELSLHLEYVRPLYL